MERVPCWASQDLGWSLTHKEYTGLGVHLERAGVKIWSRGKAQCPRTG